MTREQMIDEAVRHSMKSQTMAAVVGVAESLEKMFANSRPHTRGNSPSQVSLRRFPGRVRAIRAEFRRIAGAEKFVARPGKPEVVLQAASRTGKSFGCHA